VKRLIITVNSLTVIIDSEHLRSANIRQFKSSLITQSRDRTKTSWTARRANLTSLFETDSLYPSQKMSLFARQKMANDPYYRFGSLAELPIAAELGIRIDVNSATIDDWLRLPGLSIHQARSLVGLQQAGLELYSIEDLAAALGMPVQRIQAWSLVLSFQYRVPELQPVLCNPSFASLAELMQIPEIDVGLIELIMIDRQSNGTYRDLGDFQHRLSISGIILGKLMHYLKFQ
jgi:DNA uptake protein ComE-like DNA-binding protein